jgi:hypothetical protein
MSRLRVAVPRRWRRPRGRRVVVVENSRPYLATTSASPEAGTMTTLSSGSVIVFMYQSGKQALPTCRQISGENFE